MRCVDCGIALTGGVRCLDCDERRARPSALYLRVFPWYGRRMRQAVADDVSQQPHAGDRRRRACVLGLAAWHRLCASALERDVREGRRLTMHERDQLRTERAALAKVRA